MLSTEDSPQIQRNIQTESEKTGKDIPCKWKSKAGAAIFIPEKSTLK